MGKHRSEDPPRRTGRVGGSTGRHNPQNMDGYRLGGRSQVRAEQRSSDTGQAYDRSQSPEGNR